MPKFRRMICPHCEGTQRGLNHFDLLEQQSPSEYVVDREERAPSGRIMYDWECDECTSGVITVVDLVASSEV